MYALRPLLGAKQTLGPAFRLLFLSPELAAAAHFKAGQKLNIALIASSAALTDAGFLLRRAKLRPAFGQVVLGFCFVSRAGRSGVVKGGTYRFCFAISNDVESGDFIGCPGPINLTCRDDGS
jgi:hypothetical protein